MKLLGRYASPYTRRVGVTLHLIDMPFEHQAIPVFEQPDVVRAHNPVVRVPTLVLEDGEALVESYAILDWLDEQAGAKRLTPPSGIERRRVMKTTAIALGTIDKVVWAAYELRFHPQEKVHRPWIEHNEAQALSGFKWLEAEAQKVGADRWLCGPSLTQADVTAAIAYTFTMTARPKLGVDGTCPALSRLAARCEEMPAFVACRP